MFLLSLCTTHVEAPNHSKICASWQRRSTLGGWGTQSGWTVWVLESVEENHGLSSRRLEEHRHILWLFLSAHPTLVPQQGAFNSDARR